MLYTLWKYSLPDKKVSGCFLLLKCGVGEDSWESLGLQGDPTSPSWRSQRMTVVPWDLALSYQTENNTCLIEIYRNMVAWPWPDWRTKALTPRTLQQLTTPLPHFLEKGIAESSQGSQVFKAWAICLFAWPSINFLLRSPSSFYSQHDLPINWERSCWSKECLL